MLALLLVLRSLSWGGEDTDHFPVRALFAFKKDEADGSR
jgi:hypothetical protein